MSLPVLPSVPARAGNPCLDHGCSACCHDIEMLLTEADLQRIHEHLEASGRKGLDFHFQAEDGYLQLRTRDGPPAHGAWGGGNAQAGDMPSPPLPSVAAPRPCVFLAASGACSIHAARPEGCRLYPAAWDEGLRQAVLDADYCPHTDGFHVPAATGDAVRRLAIRLEMERTARHAGSALRGHGPKAPSDLSGHP